MAVRFNGKRLPVRVQGGLEQSPPHLGPQFRLGPRQKADPRGIHGRPREHGRLPRSSSLCCGGVQRQTCREPSSSVARNAGLPSGRQPIVERRYSCAGGRHFTQVGEHISSQLFYVLPQIVARPSNLSGHFNTKSIYLTTHAPAFFYNCAANHPSRCHQGDHDWNNDARDHANAHLHAAAHRMFLRFNRRFSGLPGCRFSVGGRVAHHLYRQKYIPEYLMGQPHPHVVTEVGRCTAPGPRPDRVDSRRADGGPERGLSRNAGPTR